tara:strand:- start:300 stop:611 length:312 start_codon:yes stop_codon:yes gene_type:complete
MVNDDAKFFFCLCGFIGFSFFLTASYLNQKDLIIAVLYGSCGCLIFSTLGRFLLGMLLKGNIEMEKVSITKRQNTTASDHTPKTRNAIGEAITKVSHKIDSKT